MSGPYNLNYVFRWASSCSVRPSLLPFPARVQCNPFKRCLERLERLVIIHAAVASKPPASLLLSGELHSSTITFKASAFVVRRASNHKALRLGGARPEWPLGSVDRISTDPNAWRALLGVFGINDRVWCVLGPGRRMMTACR